MGLFNKLFGSSSDNIENKNQIRSQFKNDNYFKKEIERFEGIIQETKTSVTEKAIGATKPFTYWSISSKFQKIIELKYSTGQDCSDIKQDYISALHNYIKGWDEKEATYSDMLLMISLGVLFEVGDIEFKKLIDYVKKTDNNKNLHNWHPDALLWFLLNSGEKGNAENKEILFPKIYGQLYQITQLPKPEAEKAINDYLDKWYNLHKDEPWYNTHLRDKGYSGYWAWEVAALVKVMGLDDSSFKDNPYYPYDMVHWKDENK
jgi:hemerythrin superfamily protein